MITFLPSQIITVNMQTFLCPHTCTFLYQKSMKSYFIYSFLTYFFRSLTPIFPFQKILNPSNSQTIFLFMIPPKKHFTASVSRLDEIQDHTLHLGDVFHQSFFFFSFFNLTKSLVEESGTVVPQNIPASGFISNFCRVSQPVSLFPVFPTK